MSREIYIDNLGLEHEISGTVAGASSTPYYNGTSGLSATTVQGAVDELASEKMEKVNPTGTGSLSLNKKSGTTLGINAVVVGGDNEASADRSFAEGFQTKASANQAHSAGYNTQATGNMSFAMGEGTKANHRDQFVFGKYNVADPSTADASLVGNYVEIVGNGISTTPSNARTLDWDGNETLAGDLKINSNQSLSTLWTTLSGLTVLSGKSGSIASFSTDIADKLFSCYVNVKAVQSGSGTPSPSNIRSISGWSGANVTACGKNILDYNAWKSSTPAAARCTYVFQNNGISVTATSTDGYCIPEYEIPVRSGQQITLSWGSESNIQGQVYVFFSTTSFVYVQNSAQKLITTIPDDCSKIKIRFGVANTGNTINYANLQIEYNSTSTTYESYKGTTHTIPFGQTVYGGVLDVTKGVLTITHGYKSYSGGFSQASNGIFYIDGTISDADTSGYSIVCLSNRYDYAGVKTATSGMVGEEDKFGVQFLQGLRIMVCDTSFADDTAFNNSLSSTPLQIVYPLATPTVIQLTPTEVKTILGQNNIFGDCGDIDLKYLETIGNRL